MNRREALRTLAAGSAAGALAGGVAVMAMPSAAAEPINADLAFAIERHRAAFTASEASGRLSSTCDDARRILSTADTEAAFRAADDAFNLDCGVETAALDALMAAPILTLADMRAKAAYLAAHVPGSCDDSPAMLALLASMGGTTDGMSATSAKRDPLAEIVSAYTDANDRLNASHINDDDAVAAYCDAYINPLRDRIMEGVLAPTTMAGALAALRLADRSMGQGDIDLGEPLVAAVLEFFEGRA